MISDSGIILEVMGFLLLLPPLQDSVWKFKVRNEEFYKSIKNNYQHDPFHILIKNLSNPHYGNYYKLKEKFLTIGVVMVMFGLGLQISIFNLSPT